MIFLQLIVCNQSGSLTFEEVSFLVLRPLIKLGCRNSSTWKLPIAGSLNMVEIGMGEMGKYGKLLVFSLQIKSFQLVRGEISGIFYMKDQYGKNCQRSTQQTLQRETRKCIDCH